MPEQTTPKSDEDLVLLYKQTRDKSAIGELFKRHSVLCFAVSMKYLKNEDAAHDATMAVFERLFEDLLRHDIRHFRNWLHSVCRNHCLMELRKVNPEVSMHQQDEEESGAFFMQLNRLMHQENDPEEKEAKLEMLEEALTGLKPPQRQCIELFYLGQKSYEEITLLTGYNPNEVKSHIQNGRRNLKLMLQSKGINMGVLLYVWILQAV